MKRFGPKDETWALLYDKSDADYISNLSPDSLFDLINKESDIFIQISKADDIVTFRGLSYCCQLITGDQTVRYTFMCVGSDGSVSSPFQQLLIAEAASRLNMSISGSMTRSGQALRFVGNFPASFQTITARESGVNTVSTPGAGILLNRNAFPTPIVHTAGVTAFTLATLITFAGV